MLSKPLQRRLNVSHTTLVSRNRVRFRPQLQMLEDRLTPAGSYGDLASFTVVPEVPVLTRLDRFVPNAVPQLSSWVGVSTGDANLDPAKNGGDNHIYVVAHGWAPGFKTMVQDNQVSPTNPLKWWQTLDTALPGSPGTPSSPEMFYGNAGDGIQISPSGLAYSITQADPKAVVLAYSWIDESATDNLAGSIPDDASVSEAYTAMNGQRLANAMEQALPSTFNADGGALHLIGHSHGSKVATVATLALDDTNNANYHVAQLTLLDSPEAASDLVSLGDAANNLWLFLGGLNISHTAPTASQTFVDNYISEFDSPIGPIQGVNPFNTSQPSSSLQQVVDVNLNGGVLYSSIDFGALHGYAFDWYGGASLPWAQNPTPSVADQWSPLINPANLPTAGSYTQSWTTPTQPQFQLTAGPTKNTVADTPTFTNVPWTSTSVTTGSSYNPSTGAVTLSENGTSTATFVGEFKPESGLNGISFTYQFSNVGQGDQLVISVDTGLGFTYKVYYVMTGTVAGTTTGVGTLSLTSIAGSWFKHDVQIQLIPLSGSSGATVTIGNLQEFATAQTGAPVLDATPPGLYSAVEGKATGDKVLAVFTDPNAGAIAADFQTQVNWGGPVVGTPAITVTNIGVSGAGSIWQVTGNPLYLEPGSYAVNVMVRDIRSGTSFSTTPAGQKTFVVADALLTDTTPPRVRQAVGGKSTGNAIVATFRDANGFARVTDYKVVISWGDGTISRGTLHLVSRTAAGSNWSVVGRHVYAKPRYGSRHYTVTVTIADIDGKSVRTRKTQFVVHHAQHH
jgi:hypothetical protein